MAKKYRYKQLTPQQLGINTTGITIPITKFRVQLDDGTRAEILPPGGKPQFDDGDEIDIDVPGMSGKNKRLERHMNKDPRFAKQGGGPPV